MHIMLGHPFEPNKLPKTVEQFEQFKSGESAAVPDLPFTMLSSLPLTPKDWIVIARNASWQTTRMNLNTFARHGVFEEASLVQIVADG